MHTQDQWVVVGLDNEAWVEPGYGLASALKDCPKTISSSDPSGRCLSAVVAGCQLVVLPTRRYVPGSVFLSEEAARRKGLVRLRRRAAAAAAAAADAASKSRSGDAMEDNGKAAPDSDSGDDDEDDMDDDDDSVGARESDSDGGGAENGAATNGGGGGDSSRGRSVVSKPFTIDLEEAGITG